MARILIVEDELDIVLSLKEDLRRQGYEAGVATDGRSGLQMGTEGSWDLILMDLMLPKMDGFEVCVELRRAGVRTPIIMLTALAQEAQKVMGLDSGADDYITKPFSLHELRARIRVQLRRTAANGDVVFRFGDCELDFSRAELRRSGQSVEITAQELRLLRAFLNSPGRVLTRDQLIDAAWGRGIAISDRAVDTHVFNLRRKIEPVPSAPKFLVGVRGLGYRFEK